ncbi:RING finger protein 207-like isoform X1 [Sycon ciliatum]|uniref:RING finger protein 207-like isoform X1 n=1 Tax=Sycon ciliatum TaxID=27933 RepID=UPI0031F6ED95
MTSDSTQTPPAASYPFICFVCKERYQDPKVFPTCFHSVCDGCVQLVTQDSTVTCPNCQAQCSLADLKDDRLLQHLLHSTGEDNVQCANCEKPSQSTHFCHTCCQPLCQSCRFSTHAAKMFSSHNIVLLENRSRDSQPMSCPVHDKLFIMFSVEDRRLICINCFRDMDSGTRSQCMDIESAYAKSSAKLKTAIVKLQQLDRSVAEAIGKVEILVDETQLNATTCKDTIDELLTELMEQLTQRKVSLIEMVEKQKHDKVRLFRRQLGDLRDSCPVIQAALETSNVFSSATNRYEFLDLVNDMTERLDRVAREPHRLFPIQSSQISCNYRLDIAKTVDQLLSRKSSSPMEDRATPIYHSATNSSPGPMDSLVGAHGLSEQGRYWQAAPYADRANGAVGGHGSMDGDDVVSEQCCGISMQSKGLQQRLDNLKKSVQNLHRDLTHRKCQPKSEEVTSIHESSSTLEVDLQDHLAGVCKVRETFETRWKEMLAHVDKEKEHYQSLLDDVNRLIREHSRMVTIAKSIEPYVLSLSAVSAQVNPRSSVDAGSSSESAANGFHDAAARNGPASLSRNGEVSKDRTQVDAMHSILEKITSTQPNSMQRVEAIRTAEDLRETERRRNNELEDNLIKTKEKLKSSRMPRRSESFHGSVSPSTSTSSESSIRLPPSEA